MIKCSPKAGHQTFTRNRGEGLIWRKPIRWTRYASAAFLFFWLCGWALGWVGAVIALVQGAIPNAEFLIFWLLFWTSGGIFFIRVLWLLVRARREAITLEATAFRYDPGTSPVAEYYVWGQRGKTVSQPGSFGFYRELFRRRRPIEVARSTMTEFRLDRVAERQRLYFDLGADRIEIGAELREPDREWLLAVLTNYAGTLVLP